MTNSTNGQPIDVKTCSDIPKLTTCSRAEIENMKNGRPSIFNFNSATRSHFLIVTALFTSIFFQAPPHFNINLTSFAFSLSVSSMLILMASGDAGFPDSAGFCPLLGARGVCLSAEGPIRDFIKKVLITEKKLHEKILRTVFINSMTRADLTETLKLLSLM